MLGGVNITNHRKNSWIYMVTNQYDKRVRSCIVSSTSQQQMVNPQDGIQFFKYKVHNYQNSFSQFREEEQRHIQVQQPLYPYNLPMYHFSFETDQTQKLMAQNTSAV